MKRQGVTTESGQRLAKFVTRETSGVNGAGKRGRAVLRRQTMTPNPSVRIGTFSLSQTED